MKLAVITPQNKYEYDVKWMEAHTSAGSLYIKPGHAPIILMLVSGLDFSFMLTHDEKKTVSLIRPAFLEVNRDSAVALISQEVV